MCLVLRLSLPSLLQLLSQVELALSGKLRIAALSSGYLTPPPLELVRAPRKQVVVVVTTSLQVFCLDHNLKTLWQHDLQVRERAMWAGVGMGGRHRRWGLRCAACDPYFLPAQHPRPSLLAYADRNLCDRRTLADAFDAAPLHIPWRHPRAGGAHLRWGWASGCRPAAKFCVAQHRCLL